MDEGNPEHRAPQDHSLFVSYAHNGECLFCAPVGRNRHGNPDLGGARRFYRDLFGPLRVGLFFTPAGWSLKIFFLTRDCAVIEGKAVISALAGIQVFDFVVVSYQFEF